MKQYNAAPLPFMGQKRKFVKEYRRILEQLPDDAVYIDLFGGSGLLSHVTKCAKPTATVVYNDFDNYRRRLEAIPDTNEILKLIRPLAIGTKKNKALSDHARTYILEMLEEADSRGFVDYITLSSSLLFSTRYATTLSELAAERRFYNNIRQSDYDASGYLNGITVESCDYRELFNQYKDDPKAIFLIDPPYLSTDVSTYNMSWKLGDYLDVLQVLRGHRYIYFTSEKSQIIELCEWMGRNPDMGNPFEDSVRYELHTTLNYSSSYTDIMIQNVAV